MEERHDQEQYFFDAATVDRLAEYLGRWQRPCCLCAPSIGQAMVERGLPVTTLDIDERFSHLPGFGFFDISRPEWQADRFDIIFCDPPFFNLSLSRLLAAVRMLAQHDPSQALLLCYLRRRGAALLETFATFGLTAIEYEPGYRSVEASVKNQIQVFSNLSSEENAVLLTKR